MLQPAQFVVVTLLCCIGTLSLSQSQTLPSAQTQPDTRVDNLDPTRPQLQPRLDVDRDPVLSVDPEIIVPTSSEQTVIDHSKDLNKREDGVYTVHADADEVLLNCVVVDENGKSIRDLSSSDFRIWEDGVLQTTRSFLHQEQPVSLGILIDNSGSMRDKRAAVNATALHLLRASNPLDTTFIVNFSDHAILDQGFTSDIDALNRGLSHIDSKGSTALYDAVAASADELAVHAKFPRQALLVITDGADNASRLDLDETVHRIQRLGGPVVYTIGLLFGIDKEEAKRARQSLEEIAQQTGGVAFFPKSIEEVDSIATEVARDIRNQYTVGYHSTKPASMGGFRVVHVEARELHKGKLVVRTRNGYYANKLAEQQNQRTQAAK